MGKFFIIVFLFIFTIGQVYAAAIKIYDEYGYRLGTCKKNGDIYEAYDMNDVPITRDALNNEVPGKVLYFYDISGNLMRISNEKRTISPVLIEVNEPEHRIYKAPVYGRITF